MGKQIIYHSGRHVVLSDYEIMSNTILKDMASSKYNLVSWGGAAHIH